MSINLNDIAILKISFIDYQRNIYGISKDEAVNLLQNAVLSEKSGAFLKMMYILIIYLYLKRLRRARKIMNTPAS